MAEGELIDTTRLLASGGFYKLKRSRRFGLIISVKIGFRNGSGSYNRRFRRRRSGMSEMTLCEHDDQYGNRQTEPQPSPRAATVTLNSGRFSRANRFLRLDVQPPARRSPPWLRK